MNSMTENDSNNTQRTLIYTYLGEARNSESNPIHHELQKVIVNEEEDSLSLVRESNPIRTDSSQVEIQSKNPKLESIV